MNIRVILIDLAEISTRTSLLTASIGAGSGGDIEFLFAEDILGNRPPPSSLVTLNTDPLLDPLIFGTFPLLGITTTMLPFADGLAVRENGTATISHGMLGRFTACLAALATM